MNIDTFETRHRHSLEHLDYDLSTLKIMHNQNRIVFSHDICTTIYDLGTNKAVRTIKSFIKSADINISPDDRIIYLSRGDRSIIWNLETCEIIEDDNPNFPREAIFCDNNIIKVRKIGNKYCLVKIKIRDLKTETIAEVDIFVSDFYNHHNLVALCHGWDSCVGIIDVHDRNNNFTINLDYDPRTICFSNDGVCLAIGGRKISVWDLGKRQKILEHGKDEYYVMIAFYNDEIVYAFSKRIYSLSIITGKNILKYNDGHFIESYHRRLPDPRFKKK